MLSSEVTTVKYFLCVFPQKKNHNEHYIYFLANSGENRELGKWEHYRSREEETAEVRHKEAQADKRISKRKA